MRLPYSVIVITVSIIERVLCKKEEMFRPNEEKSQENDDLIPTKFNRFPFDITRSALSPPAWSVWSAWSVCRGGLHTRRKHCLQRHRCGDSLRVETRRCGGEDKQLNARGKDRKRRKQLQQRIITAGEAETRGLEGGSVGGGGNGSSQLAKKRLRGFSAWSPWSVCSKKCTTVRKRYCRQRTVCGRKVIRESAYCYFDGSFCQNWIKSRVLRRNNTVAETYHLELTHQRRQTTRPSPEHAALPHRGDYTSGSSSPCGRLNLPGDLRGRVGLRRWPQLRIIGGRTPPEGKWPWQVVVLNRFKEAFCGGTLVSLRWVVTAAHCVRRKLFVRVGEHDLRARGATELELLVAQSVVHPLYDPETVDNDVAMLRLPAGARAELGHGAACLPRAHQPLAPHTTCTILGWGKRNSNDEYGTNLLQEAQVSTVAQSICRRVYWQYSITDNMVCAGRGRRDSCAGDSGGPLLCKQRAGDGIRYVLHGITSFGDGCGKRGKYGIYTRTANYVPWIQHVMKTPPAV